MGKAASARNATRHGVLSQNAVSKYEDRGAYDALLEQLINEHEPITTLECMLVERLTTLFWRERRLAEAEAALLSRDNELLNELSLVRVDRVLLLQDQYLVGRYQGLLGRQISETLRELRGEQALRAKTIEPAAQGSPGDDE